MANKLLNLDEFVPDTKTIIIKGVRHDQKELTLEEYLVKVKAAQNAKDDDKATPAEQMERLIDLIIEAFPTIPASDLRSMPLTHLNVLMEFVLQAPEDVAAQTKAAQGNE